MDTKMQALEKAQKEAIEQLKSGRWLSPIRYSDGAVVFFSGPEHDISYKHKFVYEEPKPLAKDTLARVEWPYRPGVYLWSTGNLNEWYPLGINSKNWHTLCGEKIICDNFKIIETPDEFERVQTPDDVCINSGCSKYVNKWCGVDFDKFLTVDCKKCTVPVGTPSKSVLKLKSI